ncbi:MAG: type IV pilin N-terminal domain-containing protein [Methanosarcinaceae archaeon]|nr:type IV pilin N-terminal domain-containing protein [Methanosarcinaceae archaeon]MDD4497322.1 type IV pilin N-terminal domain-containing protein [Methanosarcinaceae archaeon]
MGSSEKHDSKSYAGNSGAVSGVVAQVLMTCILVIMCSLIAAFVFANSSPSETFHIKPEDWVDLTSDTIYIKHTGGEKLATGDMEIAVYINGTRYEYSPTEISTNLGEKRAWELADVIEINTSEAWGRELTENDSIEVLLINHRTREVLQGIRVNPTREN